MTSRSYNDPLYTKWRAAVRKRDGHKCRFPGCGKKVRLHVHHIKRWATIPSMRYNVANGITLCKRHHTMTQGKEEMYEQLFYTILMNKNNRK